MRMAFGGQMDEFDYHYVGLSYEILTRYLLNAGFSRVERVKSFGLFDDSSLIDYRGEPISLNVVAYK
jgi:predicted SAM-dependent methyltransferase